MAIAPTDVAKGDWLDSAAVSGAQKQDDNIPSSAATLRLGALPSVRAHIGLKPAVSIDHDHEGLEHQNLAWSRVRLALREPFAEFFGTFIMVLFGNGSVAQVLLSAGQPSSPGKAGSGNYQSISWG